MTSCEFALLEGARERLALRAALLDGAQALRVFRTAVEIDVDLHACLQHRAPRKRRWGDPSSPTSTNHAETRRRPSDRHEMGSDRSGIGSDWRRTRTSPSGRKSRSGSRASRRSPLRPLELRPLCPLPRSTTPGEDCRESQPRSCLFHVLHPSTGDALIPWPLAQTAGRDRYALPEQTEGMRRPQASHPGVPVAKEVSRRYRRDPRAPPNAASAPKEARSAHRRRTDERPPTSDPASGNTPPSSRARWAVPDAGSDDRASCPPRLLRRITTGGARDHRYGLERGPRSARSIAVSPACASRPG